MNLKRGAMNKRIGFGKDAFKVIPKKIKKKRKMKRISQDVYDQPNMIVYFESEEHLNILLDN